MSTASLVKYECRDTIATITMDDGKANVMTVAMLEALDAAFDRAAADASVVVLTGREQIFSGGYDRKMFTRGRDEILATLRAGGNLTHRILGFDRPVIAACTGHAVAQGAFLLLSADVRIGMTGSFKIGLNKVAIGLTIPHYGIEIARLRLTPPWFNHATTTGTLYGPEQACQAGFLDFVVPHASFAQAVSETAAELAKIDTGAHANTKQRVRAQALAVMRDGIEQEFGTRD